MVFIAFLNGINVGKHNRMKMSELKYMFESRGIKKVQTYNQNGNVLFESDEDELSLSKMIEKEIFIVFHYVVPVVIRTLTELEQIIKNCPYAKVKIREAELSTGEPVYVSFLKYDLSLDKIEIINKYNEEENDYKVIGREIYLLFIKRNMRNSNLARNLYRVDIHATIRNWNTIKKLINLAKKNNQ